jgi:YqaJ-like viral recombinase domain
MAELEIFDCEQGSEAWFACRAGLPTASEFATVMASGKGGGESKTRRKYMLTLIGEVLTGAVVEGYTNAHMERGKAMESDARDMYAFMTSTEPKSVGFMRRGRAGASPDSLIDDQGLLEIKTKLPHLQLECLLDGRLPPEHLAQVQGQLWISGRQWLDFCSYWPGLPLFRIRVSRDEAYIARIKVAVDEFLGEMDQLITKFKGMS